MACSINESEVEQGEAGKSDTSHFKFKFKKCEKKLKISEVKSRSIYLLPKLFYRGIAKVI